MNSKKVILISLIAAFIAEALLVFILYFNEAKLSLLVDPKIHMWINGSLNLTCSMFLILAFKNIKLGNKKAHIKNIHFALLFSGLFLVSYIIYHLSIGHIVFTHEFLRPLYLTLLLAHLICSILSLPLVFISYGLAITGNLEKHKVFAKPTMFLWLFVSFSGFLLVVFQTLFNKNF